MDQILSRPAWAAARSIMIEADKIAVLKHDAILAVDVSPTFMPGGGLPVPFGDRVVPLVKRLLRYWPNQLRFATEEGHPYGHVSLASSFVGLPVGYKLTYEEVKQWTKQNHQLAEHADFTLRQLKAYLKRVGQQILWPDHGLEATTETKIHPSLAGLFLHVHVKGIRPDCDSYGAVKDALGRSNGFHVHLSRHRVKRVFVFGLAFDFCVGETAIQLAELGYQVFVVIDATRSVNVPAEGNYPGSEIAMLNRLKEAGVKLVRSRQLLLGTYLPHWPG